MTKHLITYRGQEMSPDWPARIRAAQRKKTYTRNDVTATRIPYGQEAYWSEPDMEFSPTCGDCGVIPGELHVDCCDMEACPFCLTGQWLCCTEACPDYSMDETLDDIESLAETTKDVYAPRMVIPENQLPLL